MEMGDGNLICRLCLESGHPLVHIFDQNVGQLCVPEVIRYILRIEAFEGDGYPPYVCMPCYNRLTDIKEFREQCIQSRRAYDSLKASSKDIHPHNHGHLEPLVEIKKESDENQDSEYDAEIPLDIVKTELTEEDGIFSIGSSIQGGSLPHPPPGLHAPQQVNAPPCCHGRRLDASMEERGQLQYEMALRLWKDRVRQARRRAMESEEERERRLALDRQRTRNRRAKESPEEKKRRLERARIYMALKRRNNAQRIIQ